MAGARRVDRRVPALRRLTLLAGAALAAATLAPVASAAGRLGLAEIRGPGGDLVARAGTGSFADTFDAGWTLRIGDARVRAGAVDLRDVSMLGGRVFASRIVVPQHGLAGARVERLVVDGVRQSTKPNTIVPLGGGSYVVVLQEAVVPGLGAHATGVVGLRVYAGGASAGVAPGTELLVGVARAAAPAGQAGRATHLPWLTLGIGAGALRSTPEPLLTLAGNSLGARAVAMAERFLGTPYVWGGADPTLGFDCSGLAMYVYAQLGVSLPHYSGYQWLSGPHVPASELQPGDLVFFHPSANGPQHEGIYIGNGQFIHAPHTGDVVKISSLSDAAYALTYVGAVRP